MQERKNNIRALIRNMKKTLSDEEKTTASDKVFTILTKLPEWISAKKILLYYSLPDEISTIKFLSKIQDKEFFLPKVKGENLDILPYHKNQLETGAFNIKEPTDNDPTNPNELDLIVVPGIAFDYHRNRLGRGKGFYDRLLQQCNAIKIGIGYDFQILDSIPYNDYDIKMDIIITPNYLIR